VYVYSLCSLGAHHTWHPRQNSPNKLLHICLRWHRRWGSSYMIYSSLYLMLRLSCSKWWRSIPVYMWLSLYRLRLSVRWMSCILQKIIHQISFPLTRILLPELTDDSVLYLVGVTILLITSTFQHSHNSFIYNQTFLISTKPFLGQTCALISNVHPKLFILNFWPKKYIFLLWTILWN
jgi:hypothetical protein